MYGTYKTGLEISTQDIDNVRDKLTLLTSTRIRLHRGAGIKLGLGEF